MQLSQRHDGLVCVAGGASLGGCGAGSSFDGFFSCAGLASSFFGAASVCVCAVDDSLSEREAVVDVVELDEDVVTPVDAFVAAGCCCATGWDAVGELACGVAAAAGAALVIGR